MSSTPPLTIKEVATQPVKLPDHLWTKQTLMRWGKCTEKEVEIMIRRPGFPAPENGYWNGHAIRAWIVSLPNGTDICPKPTALYRHFAADGVLLYVGISLTPIARLQKHRKASGWYREIARIEVEWFDSWDAADAAETKAIAAEKPRHNKAKCSP